MGKSYLNFFVSSRVAFLFGVLTILCFAATSDRMGSEEARSQEQPAKASAPSATPNQPPAAESISKPKKEDEQGEVKLLYEASYNEKCKSLSDSANIKPAGLLEQFQEDEQFATLRDTRQKITQAIQQTTSESALIKSKMDSFSRIISIPKPSVSIDVSALEDLKEKKLKYEGDMKSMIDEINSLTPNYNANRGRIEALKQNWNSAKIELDLTNEKIESESKKEQSLQEASEKQNRDVQNVSAAFANTQKDSQAASNDLECLNALENKIDSEIYSLLVPQTQRNQFKLLMSALFALMVLVVILGFFTVALKDNGIRAAIFSNQTGIQFVTLFSLVIAIILFGITEILQAKELSALLGGISGYILGRVTTDRNTSAPPPPAVTPAETRKD